MKNMSQKSLKMSSVFLLSAIFISKINEDGSAEAIPRKIANKIENKFL